MVKACGDGSVVNVGIFGSKTDRNGKGAQTNAEIGAIHEFGSFSKNIPQRSFLRMPIEHEREKIMEAVVAEVGDLAQSGTKHKLLVHIGHECENAIQRAFETHGFGAWPPDKPATFKAKGSSAPLIDTGQLRRSIASEVGKPQ